MCCLQSLDFCVSHKFLKFGFAQCRWCHDMNESFLKLGKMLRGVLWLCLLYYFQKKYRRGILRTLTVTTNTDTNQINWQEWLNRRQISNLKSLLLSNNFDCEKQNFGNEYMKYSNFGLSYTYKYLIISCYSFHIDPNSKSNKFSVYWTRDGEGYTG